MPAGVSKATHHPFEIARCPRHLILKMLIILPRQARDSDIHRERALENRVVAFSGRVFAALPRTAGGGVRGGGYRCALA